MRQLVTKALVLTTLVSYALTLQPASAARFVDLDSVWCEKYVNTLSDQGVIAAEPDGKFLPNKPVTRAMLAYWR